MKPETWRTLFWIVFVLFVAETSIIGLGWYYADKDIAKENQCQYTVCAGEAAYDFDTTKSVCTCYKEDNLGYLVESKTELIK